MFDIITFDVWINVAYSQQTNPTLLISYIYGWLSITARQNTFVFRSISVILKQQETSWVLVNRLLKIIRVASLAKIIFYLIAGSGT